MRAALAVAVLAVLVGCETPAQPPSPPDGSYSLAATGVYSTGAQLQWRQVQGIDLGGCLDPLRGTIGLRGGSYSLDIAYGGSCSFGPASPYHEEGSFVERRGTLTFHGSDAARPTRIVEAHGGTTGDAWRPADTVDLLFMNPTTGFSGYLRFDRVQAATR